MCPPPQIASLLVPKKEQRDPPEDPGSGSYRLISGEWKTLQRVGGSVGGSSVLIGPRGMAMLGKWGDPVSVQGVRGASSHIRTLNKSHGFSGARRPGRGAPTGSQVHVVVGKVSGLSCVGVRGHMDPFCCD